MNKGKERFSSFLITSSRAPKLLHAVEKVLY